VSPLGRVGVWSRWLREAERADRAAACAQIEELGYGAIWLPGMAGGDFFDALELALSSTSSIVVAAGILNIWAHEPDDVVRLCSELHARHPGRFLLGLGTSHPHLFPDRYKSPIASITAYLDALDQHEESGADKRCLAALGPKMIEIARGRSLGVHSYNVSVRHTRETRAALGPDALLAPALALVVENDPALARAAARQCVAPYLGRFVNYENSWRRLGYGDDDLVNGGSDRFIDELVAHGDAATVADRVSEHLVAGASHVCVQPCTGAGANIDPRASLVQLARVLPGMR
jgi:probable F420-dependent oxidoreductase